MSGVYIKGMEMPSGCLACLGTYDCCACSFTGERFYKFGENFDPVENRLPSCPLIPVPDHGRLIDADALDADLEKQDMKTGEWDAIGFSISEIDNAPTIIPCDKGE